VGTIGIRHFAHNPAYEVVAFTAAQPLFHANRTYPESMAGRRYPNGIPIYPEDQLESLIQT
ncbi:MAG: hypothetical protein OK454_11340, partial [Thaumarchaeota archaeon]|nr:hypothetical protein [Nitrososphaerota archaeon]